MPIHKSDIHRLPLARRFLRRNSWFDPAINCTHVVGIRRATERILDLHFVNPTQIYAAILIRFDTHLDF